MEKEFENYWNAHQQLLLPHAPQPLQDERARSGKMNTAGDWLLAALPVVAMVALMEWGVWANEMLNFVTALALGVVVYALTIYVKPMVTGKRSIVDIDEDIKQHFYDIYRREGLKGLRRIGG